MNPGEQAASESEHRPVGEPKTLRELFLERIEALTSAQSIDLAEHAEHFPELLDAFSVGEMRPVLSSADADGQPLSKASLEDGGSLRLAGNLRDTDGEWVLFFMRRLQLDQGWAIHERLVVSPRYRGQAIGARFVHGSFELYDQLGLDLVSAQAGKETGRWFWAQMGFEFAVGHEAKLIRSWAETVCAALEIEVDGLAELSSAMQFARLQCERPISLADLAEAMPEKRADLEKIAVSNGKELGAPMPLGKMILLSGPQWNAQLRLRGPQRLAFEAALAERCAGAMRGAEAELRSAATDVEAKE